MHTKNMKILPFLFPLPHSHRFAVWMAHQQRLEPSTSENARTVKRSEGVPKRKQVEAGRGEEDRDGEGQAFRGVSEHPPPHGGER